MGNFWFSSENFIHLGKSSIPLSVKYYLMADLKACGFPLNSIKYYRKYFAYNTCYSTSKKLSMKSINFLLHPYSIVKKNNFETKHYETSL